jgi:hypothetical protein
VLDATEGSPQGGDWIVDRAVEVHQPRMRPSEPAALDTGVEVSSEMGAAAQDVLGEQPVR